jgi:hypothetical protein
VQLLCIRVSEHNLEGPVGEFGTCARMLGLNSNGCFITDFNVNDLNSPVSIANNLALLRLIEDVDFDIYPHVFPICAIGPNLAAQASTARCQVLGWPDLPVRSFFQRIVS